jgi:transposase
MSFYCGIDLGARKSHLCLINEDDRRLLDKKMCNDLDEMESKLYPSKLSLKILVESTFNWEWLVYGLQNRNYDVKLAHALGLKAISWSKKKTDKWDAFTLATLKSKYDSPSLYLSL